MMNPGNEETKEENIIEKKNKLRIYIQRIVIQKMKSKNNKKIDQLE